MDSEIVAALAPWSVKCSVVTNDEAVGDGRISGSAGSASTSSAISDRHNYASIHTSFDQLVGTRDLA